MTTNKASTVGHLRMMSFNVSFELPAENGVPTGAAQNRMRALCREIQDHRPDIVGVQEDTLRWENAFAELLPEYQAVLSEEPLNKHAERNAILYRSSWVCREQGHHWLTCDGTVQTVALSIADLTGAGQYALSAQELESLGICASSPNACLKEQRMFGDKTYTYLVSRRMTYAVLEHDGMEILHINTHFQHRGFAEPQITPALTKLRNFERIKQYCILRGHAEALKQRFPEAIVILTGDFNDVAESDVYRAVSETYWDAAKLATQRAGYPGSWNCGFMIRAQGDNYPSEKEGKDGGCIDFCFLQPNKRISVPLFQTGLGRASVLTCEGIEKNIYTSDHLPIIIDLEIDKTQKR